VSWSTWSALRRPGRHEHALALDPQLASAWASKGAALGELGRNAEALDAYDVPWRSA